MQILPFLSSQEIFMTHPNLDALNMPSEIDFDLDELMLIDPILPVSPSQKTPQATVIEDNNNNYPTFNYVNYKNYIFNYPKRISTHIPYMTATPADISKPDTETTNTDMTQRADTPVAETSPELVVIMNLQNQEIPAPVEQVNAPQHQMTAQQVSDETQNQFLNSFVPPSKAPLANSHTEVQSSISTPTPINDMAQPIIKPEPTKLVPPAKITVQPPAPPIQTRKMLNALFSGMLFAIIGLLIDWALHVARALTSDTSGDIAWLFFPILSIMGILFGYFFGAKALHVLFGSSATLHLDNEPDDGFASGLLKAVGIGIGIAIICWLIMLILL